MTKSSSEYLPSAQDILCTDRQGNISTVQDELSKNQYLISGAIDSTTDWNDIKSAGIYPKLLGNHNAHCPEDNAGDGWYFYCSVFRYSNLALTQIAIPYSTAYINTNIYIRTFYGTTWSNWSKLSNVRYVKDTTTNVTTLPFVNGVPTEKVIFSIKVEGLKASDVIDLDGMFEVRTLDTYPIMCSYKLLRTTSPTAITGLQVGGAVSSNVLASSSTYVANIEGIDTGVTGDIYYNLVAHANADGKTSHLDVIQDYGALIAKIL